jgi:hypothetical protein
MEFISNFWPAYVPIGIVLVAAIVELVIDAGKRERSRPSLDQLESVPGNVIILDHDQVVVRRACTRRADACPLYPRERSNSRRRATSEMCQYRP